MLFDGIISIIFSPFHSKTTDKSLLKAILASLFLSLESFRRVRMKVFVTIPGRKLYARLNIDARYFISIDFPLEFAFIAALNRGFTSKVAFQFSITHSTTSTAIHRMDELELPTANPIGESKA